MSVNLQQEIRAVWSADADLRLKVKIAGRRSSISALSISKGTSAAGVDAAPEANSSLKIGVISRPRPAGYKLACRKRGLPDRSFTIRVPQTATFLPKVVATR
jgi:hypothetical protein